MIFPVSKILAHIVVSYVKGFFELVRRADFHFAHISPESESAGKALHQIFPLRFRDLTKRDAQTHFRIALETLLCMPGEGPTRVQSSRHRELLALWFRRILGCG